jgi:hypothetical protein
LYFGTLNLNIVQISPIKREDGDELVPRVGVIVTNLSRPAKRVRILHRRRIRTQLIWESSESHNFRDLV